MILRLAVKDIVHDWLISLCLVLAVASIIAPLVILFGLKFGTLQTLRSRLVEDPQNREIRPLVSASFGEDWFDRLRHSPEVAFVVPMTRQISTTITAQAEGQEGQEQLTLMSTAAGDPLLLENGVPVPDDHACILTETAAGGLGVQPGDSLQFATRRIVGGRTEKGAFTVRVAGVLPIRASTLKMAYVPLSVVEAVEDYKDGRAVPAFGWPGEQATAYPVFDGAALFLPQPLSPMDEVLLTTNTGFSGIEPLSEGAIRSRLGYDCRPGWTVYLVTARQQAVGMESIQAMANKLRGRGAILLPWIHPLQVELRSKGHAQGTTLHLVSVTPELRTVSPLAVDQLFAPASEGVARRRLLVPGLPEDAGATMIVQGEEQRLELPVAVSAAGGHPGLAFMAADDAGQLNLLGRRNLEYDPASDRLLLTRRGYAGFRLYATTIDDVATLKTRLEQDGLSVHTREDRIGEVRRLDGYTSLIFWLIAVVGVMGGVAALAASLYASVQRKRKELNVLRLLGLSRRELLLLPVLQGLLLSGAALTLACLFFVGVAGVINRLFQAHLGAAESLCTLAPRHLLLIIVGVALLSVFSALAAAVQSTRLDPAEALRDE